MHDTNPVARPVDLSTLLGQEEKRERSVEIHVLKNSNQTECKFWLGLYRPGSLLTEDIVGLKSVKDTLHQAATLGLQSSGSVLITTVENEELRYIFLIPVNESDEVLPKAYWMSNLAKTLQGLQTKEIGCYIPRELDSDAAQHELLEELMLNLIFSTSKR